jgi:glycine cleavage system transcriptional repressor
MAKAVISTIGHDRPGLVSDITSIARSMALNIEDSRMTVLGGEFAVLMAVSGDPTQLQTFDARMQELCDGDDAAYMFRPASERAGGAPVRTYTATVVALDHPGIVAAIAAFFSSRQINIRDLTTETTPAAHTGTPIFNVTLVAEVPAEVRIHELKAAFEEFCAEEDLDGGLTARR